MAKNKLFPIILILICCLGILLVSLYFFAKNDTIKVKINGIEKVINIQEKTFEQICEDSSGFWMSKSMGMTEFRDGKSIGIEKCSGCMPDSKNMFCNVEEYLDYVKTYGVDSADFNTGDIEKNSSMDVG